MTEKTDIGEVNPPPDMHKRGKPFKGFIWYFFVLPIARISRFLGLFDQAVNQVILKNTFGEDATQPSRVFLTKGWRLIFRMIDKAFQASK